MATVPEIGTKIKSGLDDFLTEWGIFAIIAVATLGAFGLGRLSMLEAQKPLIRLTEAPESPTVAPLALGGMVVASRTGETYSYPWCAGATQISPANQRVFASAGAAQKAGYRPAKNCKGLE